MNMNALTASETTKRAVLKSLSVICSVTTSSGNVIVAAELVRVATCLVVFLVLVVFVLLVMID